MGRIKCFVLYKHNSLLISSSCVSTYKELHGIAVSQNVFRLMGMYDTPTKLQSLWASFQLFGL